VLFAGGVFLVGVAALSRFYAYPTLAVAPSDQVSEAKADAPSARIFSIKELREITQDLEAVRHVKGDPKLSEQASKDLKRKVVVYEMAVLTDKPGYVLPNDAEQTDNWPRSFTQERMVLDARTGEAVDWKPKDPKDGEYVSTKIEDADDYRDYNDDVVSPDGRPNFQGHKGLVLKFPCGHGRVLRRDRADSVRRGDPMVGDGTGAGNLASVLACCPGQVPYFLVTSAAGETGLPA